MSNDSGFDTEWTHFPVCPHCGSEDNDWWDGSGMQFDGDTRIDECGECGKQYRVTLCLSVTFRTDRWSKRQELQQALGEARRIERDSRSMGWFEHADCYRETGDRIEKSLQELGHG